MIRMGLIWCAVLLLSACGTMAEPRSWHFMQSVGGIGVGQPLSRQLGWQLPVQADVSGLTTVTVKPTMVNSALACTAVDATVEGRSIYLVVNTGLLNRYRSPVCPPAVLGLLEHGDYTVFYRGPGGHTAWLGSIAIAPPPAGTDAKSSLAVSP